MEKPAQSLCSKSVRVTKSLRLIAKALIPESIPGPVTLEAICRKLVNFSMLDRPGSPARIRLRSTAIWVKHNGETFQ